MKAWAVYLKTHYKCSAVIMAAGLSDDTLTNTAYYRNGFINVFIALSGWWIVCVYVWAVYVVKCDRLPLFVWTPLVRWIARIGELGKTITAKCACFLSFIVWSGKMCGEEMEKII